MGECRGDTGIKREGKIIEGIQTTERRREYKRKERIQREGGSTEEGRYTREGDNRERRWEYRRKARIQREGENIERRQG
jgi:hypothetical protein